MSCKYFLGLNKTELSLNFRINFFVSKMEKRIYIAIGIIVGFIALCAVVIPLVVIFRPKSNSDTNKISQIIIDNVEFPNGTYIVSLSNTNQLQQRGCQRYQTSQFCSH